MTIKQATKSALKHHQLNLFALENSKGRFKVGDDNCFFVGYKKISFHADECALCKYSDSNCKKCPLKKRGDRCNNAGSSWQKISDAKTKRHAIKGEEIMIDSLKKCLYF